MACINPNDPKFKSLLAKVGNPLLAEIEFDKVQQIKPGVDELFSSNPELANSVYEALGFENTLTDNNEIVKDFSIKPNDEKHPEDANTYDIIYKNQKIGIVALFEGKDKIIKGVNIKEEFRNKGLGKKLYKYLNYLANKNGGVLYSDPEQQSENARRLWNSLIKEGLVNKATADEQSLKFNSSRQITPQQKQQALQQYSAYLDNVFPDSKVKDIVYHGGKINKDSFKRFIDKLKYSDRNPNSIIGFFFSSSKNTVASQYAEKDYDAIKDSLTGDPETDAFINKSAPLKKGSISAELLNIKNPYIIQAEEWENETWVNKLNILKKEDKDDNWASDYKWTVNAYEKVKNHLQSLGYDGLYINSNKELYNKTGIVDYITVQKVVFEPEQIHILGSKQDIEGFKNFVEDKQPNYNTIISKEEEDNKMPPPCGI